MTLLILSYLIIPLCAGVICGNTYVMKPSERDPTACLALVELFKEAGCPDGVVNVIHGQHDCVNFICDHPDIRSESWKWRILKIRLILLISSCI